MILNSLSHRGTPPANVTLRLADTRAVTVPQNFIGLRLPVDDSDVFRVDRSSMFGLADRALSSSASDYSFSFAFLRTRTNGRKGRASDKRTPD